MFPGRTDYLTECHEQTLWVFGDQLPSADARKRAFENEHFARREPDRVREITGRGDGERSKRVDVGDVMKQFAKF